MPAFPELRDELLSVRTNSQLKVKKVLKPIRALKSPLGAVLEVLTLTRLGDVKSAKPVLVSVLQQLAQSPLELAKAFPKGPDRDVWWWANPVNGLKKAKVADPRVRDLHVLAAHVCDIRNFEGIEKLAKTNQKLRLEAARLALDAGLEETPVHAVLAGGLPKKNLAVAIDHAERGVRQAERDGNLLGLFGLSAALANRLAEGGDTKAALKVLADAGKLATSAQQREYLKDECYLFFLRPLFGTPEFKKAVGYGSSASTGP